jgi:SecD/SecF fusion protein
VRRLYLLKRRPEMTGTTIADATFQHAQGGLNAGEMEVGLTFKGIGPKEFARVTGANIGKQLAIVLDSVVYSAPVIQGRIPNGRASITGVGSVTEAKQLAVVLRAGALPVPMNIVELRSVGPTLGEENIRKGLFAGVAALLLVAVFMAWYYRTAGLIANIALLLNMVLIFSVLSAFQATLTLPGLAGIALTIGMAVDANVLIFERIREELRAGKAIRIAVDTGYKKALSAILDSNITTFGTAAILYYIGIGPIKGFGLTLMIGLAASMYTALGVTRLIFDLVLAKREARGVSFGHGFAWFHKVDLQVVSKMRYYVGATLVITLLAVGAVGVRGLNLGIDFTGGHMYRAKFEQTPDVESVRKAIASAGLSQPKVQSFGTQSENRLLISLQKVENDSAALAAIKLAIVPGIIEGEDTVGPSVGSDLRWAAIWSIIGAFILIILYIWVRFGRNGLGYGIGGVLSALHDGIVTVGLFALFGYEMNLPFVAAVLTVIGYSLNDSIVIFDRVREQTSIAGSRDTFAQRVNNAGNQCLSRSVMTHVTTLFTLITLVWLGGSSIRDFAVAMLIGVVVGGYSTYSVASPFVVWWDRRRIKAPAAKA